MSTIALVIQNTVAEEPGRVIYRRCRERPGPRVRREDRWGLLAGGVHRFDGGPLMPTEHPRPTGQRVTVIK